jgi:hypothetical protein
MGSECEEVGDNKCMHSFRKGNLFEEGRLDDSEG